MSYVITEKSNLEGTAYVEIYPGRFNGSHWNDTSIFFEEYHWEYLVRIIERHYPDYDPYGFQSLSYNSWNPILQDLQNLSVKIKDGEKVKEIRDEISFMSPYTENEFMKDEENNLIKLKQTIDQFSLWVNESLKKSEIISILGL